MCGSCPSKLRILYCDSNGDDVSFTCLYYAFYHVARMCIYDTYWRRISRCSRDMGYFVVSMFVGSTFAFPAVLLHARQLSMGGFWYAVSGAACVYLTVVAYDYIKPRADSSNYNPVF
jgi:hypothetical protein